MNLELWIAFVAATAVLHIMPGPTILTVVSYSISYGNRVKLPLVAAVALGDSTALAMSLLGLGTLLAKSAFWFQVIKWAGGLYLIYLGIQMFRSDALQNDLPQATGPQSSWKLFFNTWLVTALNPKGIIFFIAFLPHFIDTTKSTAQQMWILSITFVCLAILNASLYAMFASAAKRFLNSARARRAFGFGGGGLLCIAGLWALTAKRTG